MYHFAVIFHQNAPLNYEFWCKHRNYYSEKCWQLNLWHIWKLISMSFLNWGSRQSIIFIIQFWKHRTSLFKKTNETNCIINQFKIGKINSLVIPYFSSSEVQRHFLCESSFFPFLYNYVTIKKKVNSMKKKSDYYLIHINFLDFLNK